MPWKVPVNENGGDSNGNWPGGGGEGGVGRRRWVCSGVQGF